MNLRFHRFTGVIPGKIRFFKRDVNAKISFSQCGEDLALRTLMNGKTNGFYIDIGAHDPNVISVTKLFYVNGWSGINIEPHPGKFEQLRSKRTRDLNLNLAIGKQNGTTELFVMSSSAMTTTRSEVAEKLELEGRTKIVKTIPITKRKLRNIFDEFVTKEVDFMNIDIEGSDLDALESLEFESLNERFWPKWISLENLMPLSETLRLSSVKYLQQIGYEIYCVLPHAVILKNTITDQAS